VELVYYSSERCS